MTEGNSTADLVDLLGKYIENETLKRCKVEGQLAKLKTIRKHIKTKIPSKVEMENMKDRDIILHYHSFKDRKKDFLSQLMPSFRDIEDRADKLNSDTLDRALLHTEDKVDRYMNSLHDHTRQISKELKRRNINIKNPTSNLEFEKPSFNGDLSLLHFYEFIERLNEYSHKKNLSQEDIGNTLMSCLMGDALEEAESHFGKNSSPSGKELKKFLKNLYGDKNSLLIEICLHHNKIGEIFEGKKGKETAKKHLNIIKKAESLERAFPGIILDSMIYADTLEDTMPAMYMAVNGSADQGDHKQRVKDAITAITRIAMSRKKEVEVGSRRESTDQSGDSSDEETILCEEDEHGREEEDSYHSTTL